MPRPRKNVEHLMEDVEMMDMPAVVEPRQTAFYGGVKQMIRRIAKLAPDSNAGIDSVYDIDAELDKWYQMGYRLFATHYIGENMESWNILYILVSA